MNQELKTELTELVRNLNLESRQEAEAKEESNLHAMMKVMTIASIFTASFCLVIMCCALYITASLMK